MVRGPGEKICSSPARFSLLLVVPLIVLVLELELVLDFLHFCPRPRVGSCVVRVFAVSLFGTFDDTFGGSYGIGRALPEGGEGK
jgi:hypothetical protein